MDKAGFGNHVKAPHWHTSFLIFCRIQPDVDCDGTCHHLIAKPVKHKKEIIRITKLSTKNTRTTLLHLSFISNEYNFIINKHQIFHIYKAGCLQLFFGVYSYKLYH